MKLSNQNKNNLKLLFNLIKRFKFLHITAGILMLINSILSLGLPVVFMKIVDDAILKSNKKLFVLLLFLYLAIMFFNSITGIIVSYIYNKIGTNVVINLKRKLFLKLYNFRAEYFNTNKTGDLMETINGDVSVVQHLTTSIIYSTLIDILSIISIMVFLAIVKFDLLVVGIIIQPLIIPIQNIYNEKISKVTFSLRAIIGKWSSDCYNMISLARQYIVYNTKKYFFNNFTTSSNHFYNKSINLGMDQSINKELISLISGVSFLFVLGLGGYKVIIGSLTIGALTMFLQYSQKLVGPIIRLSQLTMELSRASISLDRINNILLDEKYSINSGDIQGKITGRICFENVNFRYDNNESHVLKNFSMEFLPGRKYAIIGNSGIGKTTILNLLLRLWDVESGVVKIDDIDIKDYNLDFLRDNIGIVSQEPFIVDDTIENNISLGEENRNKERILDVLKKTAIYDDIIIKNDGINTIIGERGIKISGGQKQRIEISRIFYRDTPIMILDEPTSALDIETENIIKENLDEGFKDKTIIIISHRFSLIEHVDEIVLMGKNGIVEKGSHNFLYNKKEEYFRLYNSAYNAVSS